MTARRLLALLAALVPAVDAPAQILKEFDPISLEYEISVKGREGAVGHSTMSFEPVDTARGRRLRVEVSTRYSFGTDPVVEATETASILCDERGVEKFDTRKVHGESETKYLGIRVGEEYRITATVNGEVTQKTEPALVQMSNFGIYCGGYLEVPLAEDDIIVDYPMLFPLLGRHYPRQKARLGAFTTESESGESYTFVRSNIRKLDRSKDRLWTLATPHEPLVRLEETSALGTIVYSLTAMNGVPALDCARTAAGIP